MQLHETTLNECKLVTSDCPGTEKKYRRSLLRYFFKIPPVPVSVLSKVPAVSVSGGIGITIYRPDICLTICLPPSAQWYKYKLYIVKNTDTGSPPWVPAVPVPVLLKKCTVGTTAGSTGKPPVSGTTGGQCLGKAHSRFFPLSLQANPVIRVCYKSVKGKSLSIKSL